jgi:hypothetical protein
VAWVSNTFWGKFFCASAITETRVVNLKGGPRTSRVRFGKTAERVVTLPLGAGFVKVQHL